jgi:hypothetical protein
MRWSRGPNDGGHNVKKFLSRSSKLTLVQAALADGSSDPNSTSVDMAGFEGVMFIGIVGTVTGSGTVEIHAQQSSDDGVADAFSDIVDMTATADSSTDSDKLLVLDIVQPQKRYVRVAMTRATANSVIGGVAAIQYGAKSMAASTATAQLATAIVAAANPVE